MNTCELCGSNDFEEIFGMNYCKLCNTLSQSHGVGQEAAVENINYHGSQLTKLANPLKSQETKKGDIQIEGCRPWKTLEGFQFILKQQVETLISLGIQPELKEIVFKIWTSYLKYTQQAFLPSSDKVYIRERLRDKYISKSCENFYITKCKIKAWIDRQQKIKLENQKENENIDNEMDINIKSEDDDINNVNMDSVHNMKSKKKKVIEYKKKKIIEMNTIGSDIDDSANITSDNYEDYLKIIDKEIDNCLSKESQFSIYRMSLPLTLSIIHASLLYFDSNVLAHDLVRLVKLKKLAYNDHNNWPDDMLINATDFLTFFQKNVPTPEQVTYNTYRIYKLLNLSLLENPSFENIALRLLWKLHLPFQILHVIRTILLKLKLTKDEINSNFYFNKLKLDVGTFGVALIVVSLKLIFLLNDHYENLMSDCSSKLMNLLSDNILFNWNTWKLYTNKRIKSTCVQNIIDLEAVTSTKDLLDMYSKKPKIKIYSKSASNNNQRQQKNINLFKSFQEILKDENEISDSDTHEELPESQSHNEEKSAIDINPFKTHQILYALNGKQFILQYKEQIDIPKDIIFLLNCDKIYNRRPMTKLRSHRNADRKYRNNLYMLRQVESFKWTKSRNSRKRNNSKFNFIQDKNMDDCDEVYNLEYLEPTEDEWVANNIQQDLFNNSANENSDNRVPLFDNKKTKQRINKNRLSLNNKQTYNPYRKRFKGISKLPHATNGSNPKLPPNEDSSSYIWLLDAFSKILDCSQIVVDSYVQRIEKKLFYFEIAKNNDIVKEAVCKNVFFPKEKIIRKDVKLSLSKLGVLLKNAKIK